MKHKVCNMFTNTKVALSQIQNLLRCCDCKYVAESPCTLGGCEHIFCSKCCETRLGESCPVCSIPGHAKDAQVNRQLFNLVKLCHRLENILTDPKPSENESGSESCHGSGRTASCVDICDSVSSSKSTEVKVKDPLSVFDLSSSSSGSSPAKLRPRKTSRQLPKRTRRSSVAERITSNFDKQFQKQRNNVTLEKNTTTAGKTKISVSAQMYSPKLGSRKDVPVDQTTMTQFFDTVDDNEDDIFGFSDEGSRTVIRDKNATEAEMLGSNSNIAMKKEILSKCKTLETNSSKASVSPSSDNKSKVLPADKNASKTAGQRGKLGKKILRTRHAQKDNNTNKTDTSDDETLVTSRKPEKRRHSVGVLSNSATRVNCSQVAGTKRSRRSISPGVLRTERTSRKPGPRTPLTGSGKTNAVDKKNAMSDTAVEVTPHKSGPRTPLTGSAKTNGLGKRKAKSDKAVEVTPRKSGPRTPLAGSAKTNAVDKKNAMSDTAVEVTPHKSGPRTPLAGSAKTNAVDKKNAMSDAVVEVTPHKSGPRTPLTGSAKTNGLGKRKAKSDKAVEVTPRKSGPRKLLTGSAKRNAKSETAMEVTPNKPGCGPRTPLSDSAKKNAVDKRNAKGETSLQVACIKGDVNKVQELLQAGASPNTRDNAGWSPLHEACHHGHLEVAELLLKHGALINVPGTGNDTPLHDAVSHNRVDCAKLLVSSGASLTARNIQGYTPVDFASTKEMKDALKTKVTTKPEESEMMDALEYQEPCFLATALSRDQKITLQKCANVLQAKILDSFIPEVTHIVTSSNEEGMCPRTIKYLMGVLQGKWIVNMEWVDLCLEYGSKVCEEAFEVPGTSTNPNAMSAAKGRFNRQKQLPGLFDGCQFYFHGNFEYPTPEKEELKALVKAGGGQVLSREPKQDSMDEAIPRVPFHAPSGGKLRNCYIYVVHNKMDSATTSCTPRMCAVPASWIMDCIAAFRILDLSEKS